MIGIPKTDVPKTETRTSEFFGPGLRIFVTEIPDGWLVVYHAWSEKGGPALRTVSVLDTIKQMQAKDFRPATFWDPESK